jgi:hypothetical protein
VVRLYTGDQGLRYLAVAPQWEEEEEKEKRIRKRC